MSGAESHKNEGFLKSAWHKLTHQHDDFTHRDETSPAAGSKAGDKDDEDEPKRAAGSGS